MSNDRMQALREHLIMTRPPLKWIRKCRVTLMPDGAPEQSLLGYVAMPANVEPASRSLIPLLVLLDIPDHYVLELGDLWAEYSRAIQSTRRCYFMLSGGPQAGGEPAIWCICGYTHSAKHKPKYGNITYMVPWSRDNEPLGGLDNYEAVPTKCQWLGDPEQASQLDVNDVVVAPEWI